MNTNNNQNGRQIILNVDHIDTDDNGGISLKSVWAFIKLSFIRAVLFMAVAAILATFLVILINQTASRNTVVSASIELIYPGAEEGTLPSSGGHFSQNSLIAPHVLTEALSITSLSATVNVSTLRHSLSVHAYMSPAHAALVERAQNGDQAAISELAATEFFPTRFSIILSEPNALGLSQNDSQNLLNAIIEAFTQDFIAAFVTSAPILYDTFIPNVTAINNYLVQELRFRNALTTLRNTLQERHSRAPHFRAPNSQSFSDLVTEANLFLNEDLAMYRTFIAMNGVTLDPAREVAQLEAREAPLNHRRIELTTRLTQLTVLKANPNLIETIRIPTDEDGVYIIHFIPTNLYLQFVSERNEIDRFLTEIDRELAEIADIKVLFENLLTDTAAADALRSEADKMLAELSANLIEFVTRVNAVINAYNEMHVYGNVVRIVHPAVYSVSHDTPRTLTFVLIYGGFILAGLIAALAVTQAKKTSALKKQSSQNNGDTQADDSAAEETSAP